MTPDEIKKLGEIDLGKKQIEGSVLWIIANNADEIGVELERIQYMLQILNENLEDEVSFLKETDNGYAQHFVSRYDIHRAQLEMVELWLHKNREKFAKLLMIFVTIARSLRYLHENNKLYS